MNFINILLSYIKLFVSGICIIITSLLCAINPKNELKYRKKCSKFLIKQIAKKIIIEGKLDNSAQLLIGNHTHNLDIPLMESIISEKIIWIAKKELGEIPIIKYLLTKTDMILVDRNNKKSIIKTIKEVKDRVNKGFKVVVFPEGTRNKLNPKKLLPWKQGVKGIAEKLNLKVQPFVIINIPFTIQQPFQIKKQEIKIIFLESFYPKDNPNWYEETKQKMQQILNYEYSKKESNEI